MILINLPEDMIIIDIDKFSLGFNIEDMILILKFSKSTLLIPQFYHNFHPPGPREAASS
jgi:hypothetical protein